MPWRFSTCELKRTQFGFFGVPTLDDDQMLFHYTSAEGLLGLLGGPGLKAKMWLTQVHYLNDSEEALHAYKLTAYELRRLEKECPNLKRAAAGFLGIPHDTQPWQEPTGFAVTREFTFSLSEERDLLSQWRGYTPLGGYSVGYRVSDLKRFAAHHGIRIAQCIYEEAVQRELVATALIQIEDAYRRGEIAEKYPGVPDDDLVRATASVRFQQLGHRLGPIFKHPSFAEEREWRMIGMIGVNDPRARWRTRGNMIVPYAELDVGLDAPCPLRPSMIIVGPGVNFELASRSIGYVTFDPPSRMEVVQSQSTLRP